MLKEASWTGFGRAEENLVANHFPTETMFTRKAFELVEGYDLDLLAKLGVVLQPNATLETSVFGAGCSFEIALAEWDFYLRLLEQRLWGGAIPEFLLWEAGHAEFTGAISFAAVTHKQLRAGMEEAFRKRHAALYARTNPVAAAVASLDVDYSGRAAAVAGAQLHVLRTTLSAQQPHLLLVTHWSVVGGAEWMNIRLLKELRLADGLSLSFSSCRRSCEHGVAALPKVE